MLRSVRLVMSSLASCAAVTAAVLCFVTVAGCEQDAGQRCQVDEDCSSGLVCPPSTFQCQPANTASDGSITPDATIDAGEGLPVDAAVDAAPDDAPVDALVDAAVDAA